MKKNYSVYGRSTSLDDVMETSRAVGMCVLLAAVACGVAKLFLGCR